MCWKEWFYSGEGLSHNWISYWFSRSLLALGGIFVKQLDLVDYLTPDVFYSC